MRSAAGTSLVTSAGASAAVSVRTAPAAVLVLALCSVVL